MSKYLCHCGSSFNRKYKAKKHSDLFQDTEDSFYHVISKKGWKGRLADYPWNSCFRLLGGWILLQVILHHFNIEISIAESAWLGASLGLILY